MPLPPLSQNFRDMLGLLLKHRVEFVLIGAHAVGAHGFPRSTGDMDFLVRPNPENADRLWRALVEFGVPLHHISPQDFHAPDMVVQFGLPPHRIDFVTSVTGVDGFEEVWEHRIEVEMAGMTVPVIGRAEIIRNKRSTGRLKDKADVELLEQHPPRSPEKK